MPDLSGSTTHEHLVEAFANESRANRRFLWFAQQADVDGRPDVAALFRSIADSETGHANGLLEHLVDVGDPVTGLTIGETDDNLRAAIDGERRDADELYPAWARTARDEGFDAIADWFDTLARAERGHVDRLRGLLAPDS